MISFCKIHPPDVIFYMTSGFIFHLRSITLFSSFPIPSISNVI